MTATSPTSSQLSTRDTCSAPGFEPAPVDASCRLPFFALCGGAAAWLVLSSAFGLIASIKFHGPQFLADCPWLTYGRVYPAWSNLLVYGFCIPMGLGVGLWMLARLGRVPLPQPWLVVAGAKLWHLGVLVGLVGILSGDSTGFEWLEMPRYAAVILFAAFVLMALCGFVTQASCGRRREGVLPNASNPVLSEGRVTRTPDFIQQIERSMGLAELAPPKLWLGQHARDEAVAAGGRGDVHLAAPADTRTLYPSHWFILASLFWFPWIYSTANLLLLVFPVRGVVQASIAWWFSGNLLGVWLGLAGVAATFYFLPALAGRPLRSHYTALFAFWTLILFGSWTGIPAGAILPAWMPAASGAATVLTLVPALAVATTAIQTARGAKARGRGGPLDYVKFGAGSFAVSGALLAASAVPQVSRVTDFTWLGTGLTDWRLYGFFAMTMFGAAYHILPRVAGLEFPFAKLIRVHFWLGAIGTLLLAVPLVVGGVVQGLELLNPNIAFVAVVKSTLMFLRISTLGDALIAVGNLLFLLNVTALVARYYRAVCRATYTTATARLQPAEVRP